MFNPDHALRHSKAAGVTVNDPAVYELWNPITKRTGRVIEKAGQVFVQVLDAAGLQVTAFERYKPAHGGVEGTKAYLIRQGYQ